uniref:hypothetical protein n=1 Tax=Parabacteroides merdae TaxID=46503 RepID=UPI003FEE1CC2
MGPLKRGDSSTVAGQLYSAGCRPLEAGIAMSASVKLLAISIPLVPLITPSCD